MKNLILGLREGVKDKNIIISDNYNVKVKDGDIRECLEAFKKDIEGKMEIRLPKSPESATMVAVLGKEASIEITNTDLVQDLSTYQFISGNRLTLISESREVI